MKKVLCLFILLFLLLGSAMELQLPMSKKAKTEVVTHDKRDIARFDIYVKNESGEPVGIELKSEAEKESYIFQLAQEESKSVMADPTFTEFFLHKIKAHKDAKGNVTYPEHISDWYVDGNGIKRLTLPEITPKRTWQAVLNEKTGNKEWRWLDVPYQITLAVLKNLNVRFENGNLPKASKVFLLHNMKEHQTESTSS